MKKQIKNIICISIIFSFLFVSSATTVYAAAKQTKSQQNISDNAKAKAALSWGVQGAKAVSKCALGFAAKAAINGLTNLVLSLLKIDLTVSVKDQSAQNAEALANCVASVAVGLAKDQIIKITKATFNWINSGLGGNPLYVSNMSNLLNSIENTVISSELSVFRDSQYAEMYPYGRDFASAQIQTQRSMSDHLYGLQSSLFDALTIDDQALNTADKIASYSHNFAQGGWNGWLSLTQNPQNNPLGFNMLATDQLAYQKEVAVVQKKEEVAAGGGIQDKKECVQYGVTTKKAEATTAENENIKSPEAAAYTLTEFTKSLNNAKRTLSGLQDWHYEDSPAGKTKKALEINAAKDEVAKRQKMYDDALKGVNQADAAYKYTHNAKGEECTKYETVTPGSVIKDQLSKVITSPVVQLEMVRTLDDALGSVLDTLMGKLQDNGIKRIDELFNTEKSTVPGMALNSSGELIMGETGSGSRRTGAFDLKDLGNTYTEVAPGEGNYILNADGTFTEIVNGSGTGTGTGTWTSSKGSGTWTNDKGTGGAGTGTWRGLSKYIWNNSGGDKRGPIINRSNGQSIGSWTVTSTNGIGGTGIANWTVTGMDNSGTWTSSTGTGTWTTGSAINAATGTFETLSGGLPKYIWNTTSGITAGPIKNNNGSAIGSWTATSGTGGTEIATWTNTGESHGKGGTWTSSTGTGTWTTGSAINATTGTFETSPGYTWSTKDNGNTGTFNGSNGSGTWIAANGTGGDTSATWTGNTGNYILDKKGVIQIQNDYIAAATQNITLFNNIMPTLGELDYCIPGPNPNWEQNSGAIFMDQQSGAQLTGIDKTNADYILSLYDTYKTSINRTYGPTSPMLNNDQSGFCVNGATNPPNCTTGVRNDPNLVAKCPDHFRLNTKCYGTPICINYCSDEYGSSLTIPTYSCTLGTLSVTDTGTSTNLSGTWLVGDLETKDNGITGTFNGDNGFGIWVSNYSYSPGGTTDNIFWERSGTWMDNTGSEASGTWANIPICNITTCKNGSTPASRCKYDSLSDTCLNGAIPPLCKTSVNTPAYLPMASAGQDITAGMVQTDLNVTDAKRKYFTNISDTKGALEELEAIAKEYNDIIKDAQDRRNALLLTSTGDQATSVGPQCTYPEKIN